MKKVKTALLILASACALASATALAGCGEENHTCDWGEWETVTAATCTTEGSKERYCKTNHDHKETGVISVDPTAHKYETEWTEDAAPNCTTAGSKSHHCEYCDAKTDVTPVDVVSTAHKYKTEWTTDVAPTCVSVGSKSHHCEYCDDKKDVTEVPVDPTAHTYKTEWTTDVEPTCTTVGSKSHHCKDCEAKTDVTEVPEAHEYDTEWTEDVAPTCSTKGSKSHHCKKCSAKTDVTPVDELPHNYTGWTAGTPAQDGSVKATGACSCGATGEKSFGSYGQASGVVEASFKNTLYTITGSRVAWVFDLNRVGKYTVQFDYLDNAVNKVGANNVMLNGTAVANANGEVLEDYSSYVSMTLDSESRVVTLEVTVNQTNLHSELRIQMAKLVRNTLIGVNITAPEGEDTLKQLAYGENTVTTYLKGRDYVYEFTSAEAKKYSVSVPVVGLQVALMREESVLDLIDNADATAEVPIVVNFDMAAGETVKFVVSSNGTGDYKLTIGEPKADPKLVLDADPMNCTLPSNNEVNYQGAKLFEIAVADDVTEGEYYLAFEGPLFNLRTSANSFELYVNGVKVAVFGPGTMNNKFTGDNAVYNEPLVADQVMKLTLKGGDKIKVVNLNVNGGEATVALTSTYPAA